MALIYNPKRPDGQKDSNNNAILLAAFQPHSILPAIRSLGMHDYRLK